jgi:simple sugar transport system substrate-binding protein
MLFCVAVFSCTREKPQSARADTAAQADAGGRFSIVVFVPGIKSGSAIYEMLADGVVKAVEDAPAKGVNAAVSVHIVEGGFNQAQWEEKVTALAASGDYTLIVSSNPSLPAIVQSVSAKFPNQRFLLFDGELTGNARVFTLRYNQREQAYMAGFLAALIAEEAGGGRGVPLVVGIIAGQEYPAMNQVILPGYEEGAKAAVPGTTVDFRVVGNWFDANKAASLASGMIGGGARVILSVCGGAGDGVVQAAQEAGAKVIWFDSSGYDVRPGVIAGSSIVRQDKAAYEMTLAYLQGALAFGQAQIVGVADGFVDFDDENLLYKAVVSEEVREKQDAMLKELRSGQLKLAPPQIK